MRDNYVPHLHGKSPFAPSPHPHQAHPHLSSGVTSRHMTALHDKWIDQSWPYPENPSMDYSGYHRPPVDPLGPQVVPHPTAGRSMSMPGRPPPNNWAIEMERRRVNELQQMQERDRDLRERERERLLAGGGGGGGGGSSSHQQPYPSKPNISLLPTAVMRQIHNLNPNHSVSTPFPSSLPPPPSPSSLPSSSSSLPLPPSPLSCLNTLHVQ